MGSNTGLTLFTTILIKNFTRLRPSMSMLYFVLDNDSNNTMEAKEENIDLETTIADQTEEASESSPSVDLTREDSAKEENSDKERKTDDEDIEKGCCSHVDIIKTKYNNAKEKFWFKKIIQIFTLFSTLWMFGTK